MIDRLTSLEVFPESWIFGGDFQFVLSLEKERSALQLVTIKTKYILSAIATSGSVLHISIISLYKNSSVLMSSGSSSLNISANLAE